MAYEMNKYILIYNGPGLEGRPVIAHYTIHNKFRLTKWYDWMAHKWV